MRVRVGLLLFILSFSFILFFEVQMVYYIVTISQNLFRKKKDEDDNLFFSGVTNWVKYEKECDSHGFYMIGE